MRWRGRRESSNVRDQRGTGGGLPGRRAGVPIPIPLGRKGGGGISGIIILAVIFLGLRAIGIDPLELLNGGSGTGPQVERTAANDEAMQFASVVLAETEDVWNAIFRASGVQY